VFRIEKIVAALIVDFQIRYVNCMALIGMLKSDNVFMAVDDTGCLLTCPNC
jgi:hypothetical protein